MASQTTFRAALLLTAFPLASVLGAQQAPRVTKDAPAAQPPTTRPPTTQPARTSSRIDRSKPPALPPTPPLRVPAIESRTLSNGITVAVLENHEIQIAALRRAKDQPTYLAGRVLANALYGAGHPYERTTTEESLGAITRDDLVAFHSTYVRPQNVKFVVAGDITPAQAVEKLEQVFGSWPTRTRSSGRRCRRPAS
jgi:predicted Zn-dependent peptidase